MSGIIQATNLQVDNIKSSGGTSAMTIDSSGRVTRGVLPSWRLGRTSSSATQTSSAVTVPFAVTSGNNCFIKGGVTYDSSSYEITVPVAGVYMLGSTVRVDAGTAGYYLLIRIIKNGVTTKKADTYYHLVDDISSVYHSVGVSGIFDCSANDILRVDVTVQSDTSWHFDEASYFWGYLVG